jgi:hypothetical protein
MLGVAFASTATITVGRFGFAPLADACAIVRNGISPEGAPIAGPTAVRLATRVTMITRGTDTTKA